MRYNLSSDVNASLYREQKPLARVTHTAAKELLRQLKEDSGIGPDMFPAKILKICAGEASLRKLYASWLNVFLDGGTMASLVDTQLDGAIAQEEMCSMLGATEGYT